MISNVVRQYKIDQKRAFKLTYDDIEHTFYDLTDTDQCIPLEDDQEYYNSMINTIESAISGDNDLECYFLCIREGMNVDAIAKELNWPTNKVYKTTEKLQRRVRSYVKV